MSVQDTSKSWGERLKDFQAMDPLNQVSKNIYKWNKDCRKPGKARLANIPVIGLNIWGIFSNSVKAPLLAFALPAATFVKAGASLANKVLHVTNLDSPEAVTRRKVTRVLSQIITHTPNVGDLLKTVLKIVKHAVGLFSSLVLGFVSVSANIFVLHKLGLICNPAMAKKDRENLIISAAKKTEGKSLEKARKKKAEKKFDQGVEEQIRKDLFGNNRYIRLGRAQEARRDRLHFILDDHNKLKEEIDKAVREKREMSIADLEINHGRALTKEEVDVIKAQYWRELSEPFTFEVNDQLAEVHQQFLSTYFNWRSESKPYTYKPQPFAFKSQAHYKAYLEEYNRWNLDESEVDAVKANISIKSKRVAEIGAEVERKLFIAKVKVNKNIIKVQNKCAEYDRRVTKALNDEKETKGRPLSKEEIHDINDQMISIIEAEQAILESAKKLKRVPTPDEVKRIVANVQYPFNAEEQNELQNFALTAQNLSTENDKNLLLSAKKRPIVMPTKHYFDLKNMAVRQLKREFSESTFDRPGYNLDAKENIDPIIWAKVEARLAQMAVEEHALRQKKTDQPLPPLSEEQIQQMKAHYAKVEGPRLYEKFVLEKMFPAVNDTRKSKGKERIMRFEALEKAREEAFKNFLSAYYKHDKEENKIKIQTFIFEKASRKSNDENVPNSPEKTIPNKDWGNVVIQIGTNDPDSMKKRFTEEQNSLVIKSDAIDVVPNTTIFIEDRKREKNAAGFYYDGKPDYKNRGTYETLDEVKVRKKTWVVDENTNLPKINTQGDVIKNIKRLDVFKEAAKKYKKHRHEIAEVYLGENGVEAQLNRLQKKNLKHACREQRTWTWINQGMDELAERVKTLELEKQVLIEREKNRPNIPLFFDVNTSFPGGNPNTPITSAILKTPSVTTPTTVPPHNAQTSTNAQNASTANTQNPPPVTQPTPQPQVTNPPTSTNATPTSTVPPQTTVTPASQPQVINPPASTGAQNASTANTQNPPPITPPIPQPQVTNPPTSTSATQIQANDVIANSSKQPEVHYHTGLSTTTVTEGQNVTVPTPQATNVPQQAVTDLQQPQVKTSNPLTVVIDQPKN